MEGNLPISTSLTIALLIVAGTRLRTNAHAIADFDASRHVLADTYGLADDFVADADGI